MTRSGPHLRVATHVREWRTVCWLAKELVFFLLRGGGETEYDVGQCLVLLARAGGEVLLLRLVMVWKDKKDEATQSYLCCC